MSKRLDKLVDRVVMAVKGGPGSGNFGHGGRSGKRGGSVPKTASHFQAVSDFGQKDKLRINITSKSPSFTERDRGEHDVQVIKITDRPDHRSHGVTMKTSGKAGKPMMTVTLVPGKDFEVLEYLGKAKHDIIP